MIRSKATQFGDGSSSQRGGEGSRRLTEGGTLYVPILFTLALLATPAHAQDIPAPPPFALSDGRFADLPFAAPVPKVRPADPEEREEEVAFADPTLPDAAPAPSLASPDRDAPSRVIVPTPPGGAEAGEAPSDAPPVYAALEASDAEFEACTAALRALGAEFSPAPAITEGRDPDCGIARPLNVSAIRPGIALKPDAMMRCATARALAEWLRDDVEPAADALGRGAVTTIDHGSTYICRRRNNAATGKLSEHSFGNAVDVMAFRFADGDPLRIEPREGGPAGRFQRTVREGSCDHFTTVLGPGSNAAHANHLHLDIKERRGGYRLCE